MLIAIFVLHPACPPEPAHHGPSTPGLSAELCHHGEAHHLSAAAPAHAAVQSGTGSAIDLDLSSAAVADTTSTFISCQWRSEHVSSGRTLLLGLGISRT